MFDSQARDLMYWLKTIDKTLSTIAVALVVIAFSYITGCHG